MKISRAEVGRKLLGAAGTQNRGADGRAVGHPRQGDFGHGDAAGGGDLAHRVDDPPGPLGVRAGRRPPCPGRGRRRAGSRRAGRVSRWYLPDSQPPPSGLHGSSPTPASRAAGTISHSISRTSRLYCGCKRHRPGYVHRPGQVHRLGQLPAGEIGQPVVTGLARPHEPIQRPQRLLQRGPRIKGVRLVQVHPVQAQPPQRGVQRAGQMARGQPGPVRRVVEREAALGGQHHPPGDLRGPAGEPPADDLL